MEIGGERSPLSVRDVVERHGGEVWVERDRARGLSFFRFLLPLASGEPGDSLAAGDSRPEYYDFDLFAAGEGSRALDDRLLGEIAYTVFDTETTGLDPAGGDEILADRRDPHRQRQAAARRVLRAAGRSAAQHSRGGDPDPRHPAGDGPRPADDRRGAARVSCLRPRHGARRAQRGLRHALPEAQGGRQRRTVRPAGARYPAAVERGASRARHRTASRRSRRAWAWRCPAATRRSATRWRRPRCSSSCFRSCASRASSPWGRHARRRRNPTMHGFDTKACRGQVRCFWRARPYGN